MESGVRVRAEAVILYRRARRKDRTPTPRAPRSVRCCFRAHALRLGGFDVSGASTIAHPLRDRLHTASTNCV